MAISANSIEFHRLESLEERFAQSFLVAAARGIAEVFEGCLSWDKTKICWNYGTYTETGNCQQYSDSQLISQLLSERESCLFRFSEQEIVFVLNFLKQELSLSTAPIERRKHHSDMELTMARR
ncbi:hypothetical protein [Leptolyngbya sp. FACHB-261]|uniref:hypothetical protein n=1 Tax=Leptolyngbya sp. FACHB-261 TaxID=2692806 RepID=UPI0016879130|nr:hypothetical protein [Leptolyngbya sp. FACHB-261]MBD2101033.1 hypothetical protein [Leptolyngbya sp. FACHB-261]